MYRNDDVIEIDLWKLMSACLRKWWLIVLAAMVCGIAGYVISKVCIAPTYESTVKIYVNNSEINVGNLSISASDLTASAKLVDIYEVILNTKDTLDVILERAGLSDTYDYRDIREMLRTDSVNDTQIFQVKVTNTSPAEAHLIASTIGEELPRIISDIMDSADARIVEHSIVAEEKVAPSNAKNALLGALLGCGMVVAGIVIRELMDTTITKESDIQEITDIPILTHIPDFGGNPRRKER